MKPEGSSPMRELNDLPRGSLERALAFNRIIREQASSGRRDFRASEILEASGLCSLQPGDNIERVEVAVQEMRELLALANGNGSTAALVREEAIAELRRVGYQAPARVIDAALRQSEEPLRADVLVGGGGQQRTQAGALFELAESVELSHTRDGESHATFRVGNHYETWPLRGRAFRRFLVQRFYELHGRPPNTQAVKDAVELLEARALFNGPEAAVHVRVGEYDGAVFLDLADAAWRVVHIDATGWKVVDRAPVKFVRPKGVLHLPLPVCGGSLDELRPFLNVASDDDLMLVVSWLLNTLRPRGPYSVLTFLGEQGATKSTTTRVCRSLTDPSTAPLRAEPREIRDLMIAASNAWVVALDNVSRLQPWLSDGICRLATGGGYSTRELYSDREEVLFDAQRPVVLNGIEDVVVRGDLMDRATLITLPQLPDSARQEEREFWSRFEEARPRILGALLDAVSTALRNLASVRLDRKPRMADFAVWSTAAEPALPWESGRLMDAYAHNQTEANEAVLENSIVATPIRRLISTLGTFEGTAEELLEELSALANDRVRGTRVWPKTPRGLSGALRRVAPNLRKIGIDVRFFRESGGDRTRMVSIAEIEKGRGATVPTVPTVPVWEACVENKEVTPSPAGRSRDGCGTVQGRSGDGRVSGVTADENRIRDGRDDRDGQDPHFSKLASGEAQTASAPDAAACRARPDGLAPGGEVMCENADVRSLLRKARLRGAVQRGWIAPTLMQEFLQDLEEDSKRGEHAGGVTEDSNGAVEAKGTIPPPPEEVLDATLARYEARERSRPGVGRRT